MVGTPNRLEYDQGFFVKQGDGAADVKPIAHLYKTQVYRLADHLGVPETIRSRPPTTDTYSLPQSQEEFYFSLPWDKMDVCLYGKTQGLPPEAIADSGSPAEDVVASTGTSTPNDGSPRCCTSALNWWSTIRLSSGTSSPAARALGVAWWLARLLLALYVFVGALQLMKTGAAALSILQNHGFLSRTPARRSASAGSARCSFSPARRSRRPR